MRSGSNSASHISLSSDKARCHCAHFSHTLIPAAVADCVRLYAFLTHLAQQRKSPLPLPALLASADPSIVAIALGSTFVSHISRSSARARCHCSPFSQAADPNAVANDVRLYTCLPHLAQQRKGPLPLHALLERADPCVVAITTSSSTFVFHISLSSARARCHCSPLWHALIVAL
ncbi:unnamed protein product [Prorocentrum cordatum]|uniref:Uncharacterized protein n=1 Tax=Prorocentrum cordatum TaxID=2364126 RepID=A0ABN9STZ9_9DINO|nr:unnamed protein product [Polarella glacialis]